MNRHHVRTRRALALRGRARVSALAATVASLVLAPPAPAGAASPPPVPMNIEVPAGYRLSRVDHAVGTQNYFCVATESPTGPVYSWTAFGPQATLFRGSRQTATHFLSANPQEGGTLRPAWQDSRDTSIVWAKPIAQSDDPAYVAPDAIPWLLLQVVGAQAGTHGGTRIARGYYLQRINTVGGLKPATGCSEAGHVGQRQLVPYEADYLFYRATSQVP